ncbi:MAG: hypothetical protein ABLQ96_08930, partial [Candidatus Acidiferrum sp.]
NWMQQPCRSCDRRELDFGGCRCQAMLLAGDPAATDPVCSLSPNRSKVDAILAAVAQTTASTVSPETKLEWTYRTNPA